MSSHHYLRSDIPSAHTSDHSHLSELKVCWEASFESVQQREERKGLDLLEEAHTHTQHGGTGTSCTDHCHAHTLCIWSANMKQMHQLGMSSYHPVCTCINNQPQHKPEPHTRTCMHTHQGTMEFQAYTPSGYVTAWYVCMYVHTYVCMYVCMYVRM